MAGDIQRLFDFGDPVLIYEASSTLYSMVVNQATKQKLESITEKNAHLIPSLGLVWTYLTGSDANCSRACAGIIIRLVKSNILDAKFALQQLQNVAKSAKCQSSIVRVMEDLLVVSCQERPVSCIHQHPLVLLHNSDISVENILSSANRLRDTMGIRCVLKPLAFISLTNALEKYDRHIFLNWLLECAESGHFDSIHFWNLYQFTPKAWCLNQFTCLLNSQILSDRLVDRLAIATLEDTATITANQWNLEFLEKAVRVIDINALEIFSLQFSTQMLDWPVEYWEWSLKISINSCERLCPLYCNVFFTPLVNLNSMLIQMKAIGSTDDDGYGRISTLIQTCLVCINKKTQGNSECPYHKVGVVPKTLLGALCQFPKTTLPFLQYFLHCSNPTNATTLNMLAAILLAHQNEVEIKKTCCLAVLKMVEPNKVSLVLPAFIQVATRELTAGTVDKTALECLPKLAVHHLCTPLILRFLMGLANNQKTRHFGYQMLGELYIKQPFIYNHIKCLLQDVEKIKDTELMLMKMELIRKVCMGSGGLHSEELSRTLTNVINKRTDMENSVAVAIEAIGELCRNEALDPGVTWKMLHGKFNKANGIILGGLCNLAGTLGEISMTPADPVLQFLWTVASNSSTEIGCRAAAFRALSKFDFRDIDKHLLGIETGESDDEQDSGIPGELVLAMIDTMPQRDHKEFGSFLSQLIVAETENLGRGAYYNAKLSAAKLAASSSSLEEFCSLLISSFSRGALEGDEDVAAAVLLVYEPAYDTGTRARGQAARMSMNDARQYLTVLETLLKKVPFSAAHEWKRALLVPFGWIRFVDNMYSAMASSRKAELEGTEGSKFHHYDVSLDTVSVWTRDKISETLKFVWRQDGNARPNCCLALAALCMAVKQADDTNGASKPQDSAYVDNRHWIILAIETLLSFAQSEYKPRSTERIFTLLEQSPSTELANASRLGLSFLLPLVWDDIGDYYDLDRQVDSNFHLFEDNDGLDSSSDFYIQFSRGVYCGQSVRQGLLSCYPDTTMRLNETTNIGGRLGVLLFAVLADHMDFAEHAIIVLLRILENGRGDRNAVSEVIALLALITFTDSGHLVRSEVFQPMKTAILDKDEACGLLRKFIQPHFKGDQAQRVSDHLKKLADGNLESFEWLCSYCGSDFFPLAYVGRSKALDSDDRAILKELCKLAKKTFSSTEVKGDLVLKLASVAFSIKLATDGSERTAQPDDYSYLKESSILRHSIRYILNGKRDQVGLILESLGSTDRTRPLPPLDWDHLMNGLSMDTLTDWDDQMVVLAVKDRLKSILRRFTHPTLWKKLSDKAKVRMLENLDILVFCLTPNGLKRTLNMTLTNFDIKKELNYALLKGLKRALKLSSSPDKDQSISVSNRSILSNFCAEIAKFIRVDSYNEFCFDIVQHFLDAVVELDAVAVDELLNRSDQSDWTLLQFSTGVARLIRHKTGGKVEPRTIEKIEDAYGRLADIQRPSAFRILVHQLSLVSFTDKEKENILLHFMNAILSLCKHSDKEENITKTVTSWDIFMAFTAACCRRDHSSPHYLQDQTSPDEQTMEHDSNVINNILLNQLPSDFAGWAAALENKKLEEKIIEWSFQMLPIVGKIPNRISFVRGILRHCRDKSSYAMKLRDPGNVGKLLDDAFDSEM